MKAAKPMDRECLLLLCLPTPSVRVIATCNKGRNAQIAIDFFFQICFSPFSFFGSTSLRVNLLWVCLLLLCFGWQIWRLQRGWRHWWSSLLLVATTVGLVTGLFWWRPVCTDDGLWATVKFTRGGGWLLWRPVCGEMKGLSWNGSSVALGGWVVVVWRGNPKLKNP